MIRIQIHLTEEQYEALKKMCIVENVSMAELIRRSVDLFLTPANNASDEDRISRAISVIGRFRSGIKDLSARHDAYLAESLTLGRRSFPS
ncbi:MAG: ribbon-helix-helix domain-containing protein [Moorellaceae bacterium]